MNSPTLKDLIEALQRQGIGKVITIVFGICSLIILNLFNSHSSVDWIGNVVFGLLIAVAMIIPTKNKE